MRLRPFSSLTLVLWLLAAAPAFAAAPADGGAFVTAMVDQVVALLNDQALAAAAREQRFNQLLEADFDVPRIARYVSGRYWTGASEEERQTFSAILGRWMVRLYTQRFNEYKGPTPTDRAVKVTGERAQSEVASVVASQVDPPNGNPPIKINWHVRRDTGVYKIVDVEIEGVSMMQTQRDEFASVIQRNGNSLKGLTKVLQDRLDSGSTASLPK